MALKRLRFAALAASIVISTSTAAFAESVFLLQLGSFPSEEQANQRWSELKSRHGDVLNPLALRIAQVALPPDNSVIYRTQAGPIESREEASKMCQALAGTKDECFVVETAMFIGDQNTAAIAPTKAETAPPAQLPPALPAADAKADIPPPPAAEPLRLAAADVTSAPTSEPAPAPLPATADAPKPLPEPVELVTEPVPAPPASDVPPPPSPIEQPLGNYQEGRSSDGRVIVPPASKEEPVKPKPPVAPAADNSDSKPAKAKRGRAEKASRSTNNYEARAIHGRGNFLPDLSDKTPPAMPPQAMAEASLNPTPAQPFDMSQNASPRELMNTPTPVTADVPSPAPEGRVIVRRPNQPIDNVAGNRGVEVNVAEAIRVPLSGNGQVAPAPAQRIVTREPGVGGYPSFNPNFRTLWAQVSYFADQQTALTFWDEYRYNNPDATRAVRARVTQPYYFARTGRVSLRMGPFASMDDVKNICAAAASAKLTCSLVKDTGSSASANSSRDRTMVYRGYEESAHLQNWNMSPDAPANWVQLGSYPTPEQAWGNWETLKRDHVDLLGKMGADVNTANMSSSAKPVFRLRVGPFMTKMAARQLCDSLEYRGVSCVTVGPQSR